MMHRLHFRIFADYHQFYIWDPEASGQLAPEDWTEDDVQARAKATEHVFVVSPIRNMEVPFTLEVHETEPLYQTAEWDHIIEASMNVCSGRVEVHECTGGSHGEVAVAPGIYGVRALYKGLSTLSDDGLDGDDSYLVTLWPDRNREFRMLKQYNEDAQQGGGGNSAALRASP
ncbi:MAG: hypothetical protein V4726_21965 [Verrucomicrobiota bacterium]